MMLIAQGCAIEPASLWEAGSFLGAPDGARERKLSSIWHKKAILP
jgi:hypothetical protein